ncbi:MAG: hypothetical protein QE271_04805 [Bacteriovoracaceae bacterium]|nr:hypothetical protein [Bacteriovoracaceae bacterium]
MKKLFSSTLFLSLILFSGYLGISYFSYELLGFEGWLGPFVHHWSWLWFVVAYFVLAHVTISAMSLSFHRFHTHKSIIIHPALDAILQSVLWFVTGMSKYDWVSVHRYHHLHSDDEKDPHSPVQKGLWRVFLLGVADYVKAKNSPDVLRIRSKIQGTKYEKFISNHTLLGPSILTIFWIFALGPIFGSIAAVLSFSISPLFAVGGVNALAHQFGYRNHHTKDNSRNLGFLFPLNWVICGELDHNNHHKEQHSCSFRHRWYEFDVGYFYIWIGEKLRVMKIKHIYNTTSLKVEFLKQVEIIMSSDARIKKRCEQLAQELNTNYHDLQKAIMAKLQGEKIKLSRPVRELAEEIRRTMRANYRLSLNY